MQLKPYGKNAKKHPQKQIEQIAASIQRFGMNQPIVVDKDGVIIVGHGRYLALQHLGWEIKPEYILQKDNLTRDEVNAYRLADNKLNESDWDMDLVVEELKTLDEELLDLTGFDEDLIIEPDEADDVVPDVPEEPQSKLGDLYEMGNHRVLCGDSTKLEDVERLMDGKKADMVFTDPPYGADMGILGDKDSEYKKLFSDFYAILPCEDNIYICCDWRCIGNFYQVIGKKHEVYNLIVWVKNLYGQGKLYHTKHEEIIFCGAGNYNKKNLNDDENVWEADSVRNFGGSKNAIEAVGHPTQKPIEICAKAINNSSNKSNIVYDGFLGSGSTLIAAEKTGRICYGMELDPKYVDVIVQRYVDYTGNTTIKKNGQEILWMKTDQKA